MTIAGFDPSSGAGVTADLATMAAHGYFGLSAITALTVQSTQGVAATYPVESAVLAATLDHLVADIPPAGVKIGMLATAANARVVCSFLRRLRHTLPNIPVVLDPVMRSTSGRELLEPDGLGVLREELLHLVNWVTPNLAELAVLAPGSIVRATSTLAARFPSLNLVITGGDQAARDYVVLAGNPGRWIEGNKIESAATHGTGCAFSSALLCRLCDAAEAPSAVLAAKHFVEEAIRQAQSIGSGIGPLNLLWPLRRP